MKIEFLQIVISKQIFIEVGNIFFFFEWNRRGSSEARTESVRPDVSAAKVSYTSGLFSSNRGLFSNGANEVFQLGET